MTFTATVLQIIPELDTGGAERTTLEMTRAIVDAGGQALVAARGGRMCAEIEAAGGKLIKLPVHSKNPATMWANRGRLIRLIREHGVDLLHVRSRAPAWSALWAAGAAEIPLVSTYHGAYRASGPLKRFYNSGIVRADRVIANSRFTAQAIGKTYKIDPARLSIIPRGADLKAFDPSKISAQQVNSLNEKWLIRDGALKFLLPARLTPWKGQKQAILAIAEFSKKMAACSREGAGNGVDLQLILTGDSQGRDRYETGLRELVKERGVRQMIQIVGHCADMPAAYAWADAVLAPSVRPEAFGRVAVEAGAMALPVIAADHGGAKETIVHGETGLLTPPGDVSALADAISIMANMDVSSREAMGLKAQQRVREHYSIDAMCESTLDVYRSLIRDAATNVRKENVGA